MEFLIAGLLIGGIIGFITAAIMNVSAEEANDDDEQEEDDD